MTSEILLSLRLLIMLVDGIIEAIQTIKNGHPEDVDLTKLRKKLMALPDLPEKKYEKHMWRDEDK